MTDDKEIEKLFKTAKTEFSDNAEFTAALQQKLDKVELIRQMQESKLKSYKLGLITAFVIGVIFGGIGLAVLAHMPADTAVLAGTVSNGIIANLFGGVNGLYSALLSLLITGGTLCIALNVQDIYEMKARMR